MPEAGAATGPHLGRFQTGGGRHAQFRPRYAEGVVRFVAERLLQAPVPADAPVVDVASGTGIFTAQLAAALPASVPLIGIEPSDDMRAQAAAAQSVRPIDYRPGLAEQLPLPDGLARGITVATAAHWFDRPAFYAEAQRVLHPGGVLAVVQYVRDEDSPAAMAVLEFLNTAGEPRAYVRPDYARELQALPGFTDFGEQHEAGLLPQTPEQFVGLALSSSHARRAVERLGLAEAEARLRALGAELAAGDGTIPVGYRFQAFAVAKR